MSLNPHVLARLRAISSISQHAPEPPPPTVTFVSLSKDEECLRCGRTFPGDVHIPEGNVQLPIIEAAASSFWLSMEELKKVRGAAALRNRRDQNLIQEVLAEFGYTSPEHALQGLLEDVWRSMSVSIGPNWTPVSDGWVCPGCAPLMSPGESTTGLGGLGAELMGMERTGEEEDGVDLDDLSNALGLEVDQAELEE